MNPPFPRLLIFLIFLFISLITKAQSTFQILDGDVYHWISRAEIKTAAQNGGFHSAVLPYTRKNVVGLFDSLQKWEPGRLSKIDRYHIRYFREINSEWTDSNSSLREKPLLNYFFRRQADALSYEDQHFDVHANVVGNGALGTASDNSSSQYINTRGIEVRGMIARKVGFYTYMTENQMTVPGYVNNWQSAYNSLPHEGFWKRFRTNGYDFFTARGYITFSATRFIDFQVGHDRLHVGNGLRSLILSDFGNNFSFAKINTKVWKIQYTNVFANMKTDISAIPGSGVPGSKAIPDKFFFMHRLGINIGKRWNIGIFESIVAGRDPNIYPNSSKLDLGYLNPIIFYRSLEQNSGSPDNAALGLDLKYIPSRSLMFFGQMFLDEFLLKEVQAQNGWWGNKYAFQVGGKYIDMFGIPNLDIQGEFNMVRPYTYTHRSDYTSYVHYSQPIAHPLGANFREFIGILRYQPFRWLHTSLRAIYYEKGLDPNDSLNYGGNIIKSYDTRSRTGTNLLTRDYNNEIGQGLNHKVLLLDFTISFQPWTNLFFDFKHVVRNVGGALPKESNTSFTSLALRWNFPQRLHDF
jgi:hypothetical protein